MTSFASPAAWAQGELARFDGTPGAVDEWFGRAVALFDMDGDGLAETVVGAPRGLGVGGAILGHVQVFAGSDGSLMHGFLGDTGAASSGGWFGAALDCAGDVDGDGHEDLIVGAFQYTLYGAGMATGYARVFSGHTGDVLLEINGVQANEQFGYSVAGLGDINADGLSDLAVGAFMNNSERGVVRVFSGLDGSLLFSRSGESAGAQFGWSIAGVGDANGDGVPDLAVGSPKAGGGASFTGSVSLISGSNGALLRVWRGDDSYDQLGMSVSAAGDVDGDGLRDVAAGMVGDDSQGALTGAVRVFSHANGLLLDVLGEGSSHWMGSSVAEAGDVNGDGYADVWCGAKYSSEGALFGGAVYLVSGADGSFMYRVTGDQDRDHLGTSIGAAFDSDSNGDGIPDMVSGADQSGTGGPGRARVFSSNSAFAATYCTAKINSQGCVPAVAWSGTPSLSSVDPFHIYGQQVINQQYGIFFYGFAEASIPLQGGLLCIGSKLVRTPVQNSGGISLPVVDCSGVFSVELNSLIQSGTGSGLVVGQEVFGQFWSRDPQDPFGTGLTDAVRFTIQL